MSFYQAAVDNLIKTPQDAATIGIILCRGKNKTVVEYTLRDAKSPMGVAAIIEGEIMNLSVEAKMAITVATSLVLLIVGAMAQG